MKSTQKKWVKEEETFLQENFKKLSDNEIGLSLNRTSGSVERKRNKLGLRKNAKTTIFSLDTELEIIGSNLTYSEIAEKYAINTDQARQIFRKHLADKLYVGNISRWTDIEDEFLKQNYLFMGDSTIGKKLSRSPNSVLKRRLKLGLKREFHIIENPPERFWNENEITFLINNIDVMTFAELSKSIGRSIQAVTTKASKLGIILEGSKWSTKEDELLMKYKNKSKEELSFILNRSVKAIIHRSRKLGISLGIKSSKSALEIKVEKILKELSISFNDQCVLGTDFNFRADFVIGKVVIEAHGDYWHGNPIHYPIPNDMQKIAILKDVIKKEYFESLGYIVYEIWESEVYNDYEKVKNFIAQII